MNNFWEIMVTSTVVATFISSVISLVISRLQYKDTLRLNRYSKKWDLSIEVFKNLQSALAKIEHEGESQLHSDNSEDDITTFALSAMYVRSKEKMEATKTILDQISYLIPKEKVAYLSEEYSKLEEAYTVLLASACHSRGLLPKSKIKVNVVSEDEFPIHVEKYIDNTQKFSDELKNEIINALRDLFDT